MIKKEVFIGLMVGLIANALGVMIASILLGNGEPIDNVIKAALNEGFLGKLVSLGAIFNLLAFFIFIKKKQDYRARGVLLATLLVAIFTFIIKL